MGLLTFHKEDKEGIACVFCGGRVCSRGNKDLPDGQVVGAKMREMQSHGPEAPAECCTANSAAAALSIRKQLRHFKAASAVCLRGSES